MKDLSSHMMDIVQNSIRAEASWIQIRICEDPEADLFLIEIQDNGCGDVYKRQSLQVLKSAVKKKCMP